MTSRWCYIPNMKALGLVVLDKKIFKNCILKTYLLTPWPIDATNWNGLNNFGREPHRDHSCEVWSNSNEWFQRRRCLSKKVDGRRTTHDDGRWTKTDHRRWASSSTRRLGRNSAPIAHPDVNNINDNKNKICFIHNARWGYGLYLYDTRLQHDNSTCHALCCITYIQLRAGFTLRWHKTLPLYKITWR